jgi:SAM-dependent methyltransferase
VSRSPLVVEAGEPALERCPRPRAGVIWCREPALLVNQLLPAEPIARPLAAEDRALLEACDGERTVAGVAATLGRPAVEVLARLAAWQREAPGMFSWDSSPAEKARRLRHLLAAFELEGAFRAAQQPVPGAESFHLHALEDAWQNFEAQETTVSHAFRVSHPALGGRSYGQALADRLLGLGALGRGSARELLEIGGGTGVLAGRLLDRFGERGLDAGEVAYEILELSPALQLAQRSELSRHASRVRFAAGNVLEAERPAASADLVIANEMIADLPVGALGQSAEADAAAQRYGLAPELGRVVNVGAIHLLERLARWLRPGGWALLTEYGGAGQPVAAVDLPGHREHSIDFADLAQAAARLGLEVQLERLDRFLGFDTVVEVIEGVSLWLLSQRLLPALGRAPLPTLAYTREALDEALGELAGRIGNLRFSSLARGGFMTPVGFWALLLRR